MNALIIGMALDTNGGNFRHKLAADHHGMDSEIQALIAGRADPAGVGGRYKLAADKLGGVHIRSAHRTRAYMDFPGDIIWNSRTQDEVRRLFREADVVHLNNNTHAYRKLGGEQSHKPALLHHHGSLFRAWAPELLRKARAHRMINAVSTIDLLAKAPDELTWLPIAYDLDALASKGSEARAAREQSGRVLVVSCPTNREIKSTAALESAIADLQAKGLPVDLELVEGQTWRTSLARKARADIVFDQVGLGYGCNAIEAWGLGIPVIAGADDWTLARMHAEFNGTLPFYVASEKTIADAIQALVLSADLRAEYAAIGVAHARRFHDELPALERLVDLYIRAIAHRSVARMARLQGTATPGTFASTIMKLGLRLDNGQSVRFSGGRLYASSTVAWQLREAIASGRLQGVTEIDSEGSPVLPREQVIEVAGGDTVGSDSPEQVDEGGQLEVAVPDAPDEAMPSEHLELPLGVPVVPADGVDEIGLLEAVG